MEKNNFKIGLAENMYKKSAIMWSVENDVFYYRPCVIEDSIEFGFFPHGKKNT